MLVLDSTPIIYLAKVGLLDKLQEMDKILITPTVFKEVVGMTKDFSESEYIKRIFEDKIKTPEMHISSVPYNLSKADLESISLAKGLSCTLIMDDQRGRNFADVNGVETHGTIYLLIRMIEKGLIKRNQFKEYLSRIISEGFYISVSLYEEILKSV